MNYSLIFILILSLTFTYVAKVATAEPKTISLDNFYVSSACSISTNYVIQLKMDHFNLICSSIIVLFLTCL